MADESQLDESLPNTDGPSDGGPSSAGATMGSSQVDSMDANDDLAPAAPAPAPKRRMMITHDKYMTLQSLIVIHLTEVERDTGKGLDRDDLIDWYLETKEDEIQDVEEIEYEKELITKVLRKLVKVGGLLQRLWSFIDLMTVGQLPHRGER